ncbi:MAG: hypothetical protein H0X35_16155 [Pseudonocardiales bacterium]|nr:hypothetical protein [Pseudonocardiales bacterium]
MNLRRVMLAAVLLTTGGGPTAVVRAHSAAVTSSVPAAPAVDPYLVAFPGETYSAEAAAARAHHLLSWEELPPGAQPMARPAGALSAPRSVLARNLLIRSRWWRVAGSATDTLAFLRSHPPAGLGRTSSHQGPGGSTELRFRRYDGRAALAVTVQPWNGKAFLRVDGEDVWLPRRLALENIPFSTKVVELGSARLTSGKAGKATHLRYAGPDVVKLVSLLDYALPRAPSPCVAALTGSRTTTTFRLGHRVVVFQWDDSACDVVKVAVNGRAATSLTGRRFLGQLVDYMMTEKP